MTSKTFDVPNISCNHCVMTIKRELDELEGVASVDADAGTKTVTVEWEAPATVDSIKSLLAEINYPVAE
jgi:copper chaperone